ncbi:MAG: T9SS type A sorting domain-containing protein [Saprospiraceae bacterium]
MKRIYSLMFALTLCTVALNAQYFTEDFEAGLPAGWEVTGNMDLHADAASFASQYFPVSEHTQFVGTNDDALGAGNDGGGTMTTGVIDLTMVPNGTVIVLSMESFFVNGDYQGADETAKIFVSSDMGTTWEEAWNIEDATQWGRIGTIFTDYAGLEIMLRFEYADGDEWNYGWAFDDITIAEVPEREVAFAYWNEESYFSGGFEGGKGVVGGVIMNNGTDAITSIDLTYSDGTNSVTETITGLNIGYNELAAIEASEEFTLGTGTTSFSISIGNANGMGDDENTANDAGEDISITTVTPNPDRGVLIEEGTGTWCPWCTRGTVYVEGLTKRYPERFIGVAVHNGDPMVVAEYDDGIGGLISGYPGAVVERAAGINPSALEAPFVAAVTQAPPAKLSVGAIDDGSGNLEVSVRATFLQDVPAGYKLAAILIENGVTGTGAGFNQANAYAGGAAGPMGGYELLGGTIPASEFVYNHVGRALIGGWNGEASSIAGAMATGEQAAFTFPAYDASGLNFDETYIIGVLLNASNKPVNAFEISYDEAIANGELTSTKDVFNHNAVSVYPNPFAETATINVNLESSATVTVEVMNSVGQTVSRVDYGTLTGNQNLTLDGTNLNSGVYFVHVRVGDKLATKRVTIAK